jgi:hypothetical protein
MRDRNRCVHARAYVCVCFLSVSMQQDRHSFCHVLASVLVGFPCAVSFCCVLIVVLHWFSAYHSNGTYLYLSL